MRNRAQGRIAQHTCTGHIIALVLSTTTILVLIGEQIVKESQVRPVHTCACEMSGVLGI